MHKKGYFSLLENTEMKNIYCTTILLSNYCHSEFLLFLFTFPGGILGFS